MKKILFPVGGAALFAADQIMKSYVEQNLEKGEERPLTDRIVLRKVHNKGMCLNALDQKPALVKRLSLVSTLIFTGVYLLTLFREKGFWIKKGLSLITAGAWSNTLDRCMKGYVVDYIGFRFGNEKAEAVTYNLADFFVAAGSMITAAAAAFRPKRKREENGKRRLIPSGKAVFLRKRRDGGWQIRLLSRCLQSGNVYSVTFGDLKFFLTAQIPHHNDSRNDHDDAYDREDDDHLHQRGRAGSGVHDIVRGLTESLAEKFCNAQIQVVVVSGQNSSRRSSLPRCP